MNSQNIDFNYFLIINKIGMQTGLYTIYKQADLLYQKLKTSQTKYTMDIIIKKCLEDISTLQQDSLILEYNRILKETNTTKEIYDMLFYNALLNIIKTISVNEVFIKSIIPQLNTINKLEFIKLCYIEISRYILTRNLMYIININENDIQTNYVLSNIIEQCIYTSLFKILNLNNIIDYSKKFKETKDNINETITNLSDQISKLSNDITIIKNRIQELNIQQVNIPKDSPLNIPKIVIPLNNQSINTQEETAENKETEIMMNDILINSEEKNNKSESISIKSPEVPKKINDEENILDKIIDNPNEKEQETSKIEQDEQNEEQDNNELSDTSSIDIKPTNDKDLNIDDFLNSL